MSQVHNIDFKGRERLIRAMDQAVDCGCNAETTDRIRRDLCHFIRDGAVELPDEVCECESQGYARRQLYHSDDLGYSIMVMTWSPGQGTPLHDHCGMWCVEGVWHGELEVVQYELTDRNDNRFRFEPRTTIQAGRGSAGSLIPPHEYHTIANANPNKPAVSVHVYSGEMRSCNTFEPVGDGWYERTAQELSFD